MRSSILFAILLVFFKQSWTAPASNTISCQAGAGDDEEGLGVICNADAGSKKVPFGDLVKAVNGLTVYSTNTSGDVNVSASDVNSLAYTGNSAEIPDNAFASFKRLSELSIDFSQASTADDGTSVNPPPVTLKPNAFKGLEDSLKKLELIGVNLASAGALPAPIKSLAKLEYLKFDDCTLKGQLKGQDLKQLSKLQYFEINNSPDLSIADDAFSGNTDTLEKIVLSQVQVQSIPKSVSSLKSLRDFEVLKGGLTSLPAVFQSSASTLKELRFSDNSISSIDSGAFKGLSALTVLVLSQNQLATLPSGVFDDLTSLESLQLNGNRLTTASTQNAFSKLSNLKALGLGENQLDSITPGTFAGIEKSVVSLYFSGNKIKTVKGTSKLTRFPEMSLSSNGIEALTSDTLESGSAFSELQLDSNPIASIQSGTFNNIDVGYEFAIDDTALTEFDLSSLSGMKNLKNLSISNNADLRTIKVSSDSAVPSALKFIIFDNNGRFVLTDADGKLTSYLKKSGVRLIFLNRVYCHCQLGWLGSKWPKDAGERKSIVSFVTKNEDTDETTPTDCCNLDDTTVEDFLSDKVYSQQCPGDKASAALTDSDTC